MFTFVRNESMQSVGKVTDKAAGTLATVFCRDEPAELQCLLSATDSTHVPTVG
jgi:hypothetical protein